MIRTEISFKKAVESYKDGRDLGLIDRTKELKKAIDDGGTISSDQFSGLIDALETVLEENGLSFADIEGMPPEELDEYVKMALDLVTGGGEGGEEELPEEMPEDEGGFTKAAAGVEDPLMGGDEDYGGYGDVGGEIGGGEDIGEGEEEEIDGLGDESDVSEEHTFTEDELIAILSYCEEHGISEDQIKSMSDEAFAELLNKALAEMGEDEVPVDESEVPEGDEGEFLGEGGEEADIEEEPGSPIDKADGDTVTSAGHLRPTKPANIPLDGIASAKKPKYHEVSDLIHKKPVRDVRQHAARIGEGVEGYTKKESVSSRTVLKTGKHVRTVDELDIAKSDDMPRGNASIKPRLSEPIRKSSGPVNRDRLNLNDMREHIDSLRSNQFSEDV